MPFWPESDRYIRSHRTRSLVSGRFSSIPIALSLTREEGCWLMTFIWSATCRAGPDPAYQFTVLTFSMRSGTYLPGQSSVYPCYFPDLILSWVLHASLNNPPRSTPPDSQSSHPQTNLPRSCPPPSYAAFVARTSPTSHSSASPPPSFRPLQPGLRLFLGDPRRVPELTKLYLLPAFLLVLQLKVKAR